ncbi:hypothetical protein G7Y89_g15293 [Cudoniella acicularis]|uniref:Aminoglycoside phosphotransferase domain-containing protein n=1 Tax=Cudoniella acicularis TaxID=354080 RepID=A0A8H4QRU2_9HELO|nr:hypothetical protein G7Y89_g15293 [Cudoniella acicularis]
MIPPTRPSQHNVGVSILPCVVAHFESETPTAWVAALNVTNPRRMARAGQLSLAAASGNLMLVDLLIMTRHVSVDPHSATALFLASFHCRVSQIEIAHFGTSRPRKQDSRSPIHSKLRYLCGAMTSITLPYYAQHDELPCPLPSKEQIHSSEELFLDYGQGRKVAGVGSEFVVKYGFNVELIEGENMLFVAQIKDKYVRAPKVYALYEDPADKIRYIVMERIRGLPLSSVWQSLNKSQKEIICAKLCLAMDTLRKLPSPGGYCSIGRRPLEDCMFWSRDESKAAEKPVEPVNGSIDGPLNGPFDTQEEVNSAMIKKYIYNNLPIGKAAFYERTLPQVLYNHPPTFTHGDLQRKNIIITRIPNVDESGTVVDDEVEVVLLDWEVSGWYPSYWEYSRAMQGCGHFEDDWHYWLGQILDEYLKEWAWANMMFLELWS